MSCSNNSPSRARLWTTNRPAMDRAEPSGPCSAAVGANSVGLGVKAAYVSAVITEVSAPVSTLNVTGVDPIFTSRIHGPSGGSGCVVLPTQPRKKESCCWPLDFGAAAVGATE